jgi:DNA-binding NtrC family response regulator
LIEHLHKYAQLEKKAFKIFAPETENLLLHYEWPGNVRQLQNIIHRVVLLNDGPVVTVKMFPIVYTIIFSIFKY